MNYKKLIIFSVLILVLFGSDVSLEAATVESLLPKDLPEGWILIEGPRIYTKKTLFEHINGQAELFFKYGFQKSVFAIYQNKENRESQIELDVYDMGNVLQAFGIFSRFRSEDQPGGIGLDSYMDNHSAFFYKGKYFVMLYISEPNPSILKRFSTIVSSKIKDNSPSPKEIDYFPKNGLKPGSIQYFSEGLLGYQFLKRGFQGTYKEKAEVKAEDKEKSDIKEYHLFLAIFKNSQDAMRALKVYRDDLSKKGKTDIGTPTQFGPNALKGKDPYQGQVIIVHQGPYLLGVVGFEREKEAQNILTEFTKSVR